MNEPSTDNLSQANLDESGRSSQFRDDKASTKVGGGYDGGRSSKQGLDGSKGGALGMGGPLNFHGNFNNGPSISKDIEDAEPAIEVDKDDDNRHEDAFAAMDISTPGAYAGGTNAQGRPQTSHGRVRKRVMPDGGIIKREEKQIGLGETSVQNWDETQEQDVSKQQIMAERKLA